MIKELSDKVIGVVCGGFSRERDISLKSGQNIFQSLKELNYKVKIIDFAETQMLKNECDVAFIVLHGADGEDGSLQLLLDKQGVPFTGCGKESSVVGFNKFLTKKLCHLYNIPTPQYMRSHKELKECPQQFKFPLMLKPLNEGSSIDVFIIDNESQLYEKSAYLINKYSEFLLEEYINGREVTVGIINNPKPQILPILELKTQNRFYDYEAKYTKGVTEFILPAKLNQNEIELLEKFTLKIYQKINCFGMARIDFLICPKKGPLLLEVNTVPGMTNTSILPAQAKKAGISYNELVEIILKSSMKRLK